MNKNKKNKNNKVAKATDFGVYLKQQLADPVFKKYYDHYGQRLEVAYRLLQLRKQKAMSQSALAKKIGTTQGNIARIESGRQNLTIDMIGRIARTFNKRLVLEIK